MILVSTSYNNKDQSIHFVIYNKRNQIKQLNEEEERQSLNKKSCINDNYNNDHDECIIDNDNEELNDIDESLIIENQQEYNHHENDDNHCYHIKNILKLISNEISFATNIISTKKEDFLNYCKRSTNMLPKLEVNDEYCISYYYYDNDYHYYCPMKYHILSND